jgi:hypothetical protein
MLSLFLSWPALFFVMNLHGGGIDNPRPGSMLDDAAVSFTVRSPGTIQLSPNLRVHLTSVGRSHYAYMIISFLKNTGDPCTYGEWKLLSEKVKMTYQSISESSSHDYGYSPSHQGSKISFTLNQLKIFASGYGRRHSISVYLCKPQHAKNAGWSTNLS